jgi:hypothetical protein
MAAKTRKQKWFIRVRGSYLPHSWQGWLLYIPFSAYLIYSAVIGWQNTDSFGHALVFIVPNWIAAAVIMTWIAQRTS